MLKVHFKNFIVLTSITVSLIFFTGCSKVTSEDVIKNLNNGTYGNIAEDYNKLNKEDQQKVYAEVGLKSTETLETFMTNDMLTEDDLNKTIDMYNTISDGTDMEKFTDEMIKQITNLYQSKDAFKKGEEAFNAEDYETALANYTKVVQEDFLNYEKAQMQLKEIKRMEETLFNLGDTVDESELNITFNTMEFSYDVLPKNISGFYTHYAADPGKVYFQASMTIKNNMKQNLPCDEIVTAELVYDGEYKYSGFTVVDSSDERTFDYANITSIDPLETRGIRVLFDLPQELETSSKSIKVKLTIGEKTFTYNFR